MSLQRWAGILLICATALAAAGPAGAQATKTDKIRDLLEITQTEALLQQILPTVLQQSRAMVTRRNPEIPEAVWQRTFEVAEQAFLESIADFIEKCVPIYARNFTEEEIDGMLEFYRTPVGRSVVTKLPQVTQESMLAGRSWGMAVGEEIFRRIVENLADEGYKI